jgi:chromosome segregation ATPase
MTVGSIRTTVSPPLTSGIYEALLEKAERERDEAREKAERYRLEANAMMAKLHELQTYADKLADGLPTGMLPRDVENLREANAGLAEDLQKAERERNYYKESIEEISTTIQDWLDSIVQEPSLDFIKAIKAWADKKLNNG